MTQTQTQTGNQTHTRPQDRGRQAVVLLSAAVSIPAAALVGAGAWGDPVAEAAGGALAADATLLAPAGPAFSVWSLIYAALIVYTLWHSLPGSAAAPSARATGWWAAASMLLNAAWLLVIQEAWLWVSVLVILALCLVLGRLLERVTAGDPATGFARVLTQVAFGLYLGWSCVATCANVAATLADQGVQPSLRVSELLAVLVLLAVCGIAAALSWFVGAARWAVAATVVWGLVWISWGRLEAEPASTTVGVAALVAVAGVVGLTYAVGRQRARA